MSPSAIISRRKAIQSTAAAIFVAILADKNALAGFAAENAKTLVAAKLAKQGTENLSKQFRILSRLVTGRDWLKQETANKLFPYFRDEPWGKHHIGLTLSRLKDALDDPLLPGTVPELLKLGYLEKGERWFVQHLLTTWYLGIYYHERLTERVLYEEALMWDTVSDLVPVAGYSDREFGFWSEPPSRLAGDR